MPVKITGKILDETGQPLYQIAQVSEMPTNPFDTVAANVWSDAETGNFTFYALYPHSMIKVEAHGYKPVMYAANNFPAVVKLDPAIVIEGKTKPKKDYTWAWIGGGLLAIAALAMAGKKAKAEPKPAPAPKALPKPKTVIV